MSENKEKYCIGIDFGTRSGRTLLINAVTGEEKAESVYEFVEVFCRKHLVGVLVKKAVEATHGIQAAVAVVDATLGRRLIAADHRVVDCIFV